ncbi:DNA polymerase eta [Ixodes scapularis]|uniref:DNA polymerase eta n=1 Tax=Ixodes scapularis TaxID=6945 RepID=UPI001C395643|nr:DNA polymerase eta [Ixodes scapularis]
MAATECRRVISLVDMDCFYVQVEQRLAPEWKGKPCAVAQYNTFQGGGLIAVNYEARALGVKRGMRGEQALKLAKDLHLFRVPEQRGKADLTRYRDAGAEVLSVLCQFGAVVQRASIDEAYLDLTPVVTAQATFPSPDSLPSTHVVGYPEERGVRSREEAVAEWLSTIVDPGGGDSLLARGCALVERIRAAVLEQTGFDCSAGVAHNKVLAKLVCGLHKPRQQTVLPHSAVPTLFATLPVHKLRNLGGKLGEDVREKLQVEVVADLLPFSQDYLCSVFGHRTGQWLYKLARGVDDEPVTCRKLPQSIGCGKNFTGSSALHSADKVKYWVEQLAAELAERLQRDQQQNDRTAQLLTVGVTRSGHQGAVSRSCPMVAYCATRIAQDALAVLAKLNMTDFWTPALTNISLSATRFRDGTDDAAQDISKFLVRRSKDSAGTSSEQTVPETVGQQCSSSPGKKLPEPALDKPVASATFSFSKKLKLLLVESTSEGSGSDTVLPEKGDSGGFLLSNLQTDTASGTKATDGSPAVHLKIEDADLSLESPAVFRDHSGAGVVEASKEFSFGASFVTPKPCSSAAIETRKLVDFFGVASSGRTVKEERDMRSDEILPDRSEGTQCGADDDRCSVPEDVDCAAGGSPGDCNSGDGSVVNLDPSLVQKCERCGKAVPVWKVQEHEDYHLAQDLSKPESTLPLPSASVSKRKASASRGSKHKRKKARPEKVKTLKDFFR